jgi:hypothetical protein
VISKNLTYNFLVLIKSKLGPEVARGPPVGLRRCNTILIPISNISVRLTLGLPVSIFKNCQIET